MTTLTEKVRTARKPHRCYGCNGPIPVGSRYRFWSGTSDCGAWYGVQSYKECPACCKRYGRAMGEGER